MIKSKKIGYGAIDSDPDFDLDFNFRQKTLLSVHPCNMDDTTWCFQSRNENFFARSRKTRADAEAYCCTPHKEARSLTQRLRKKAIYGWKLPT
ncbi:hypothetical protein Dole_3199 [Desulfosudis oleivorans Hxd3]|uniref:Uncharacterized protein n=1 Tax=Desulfosudis oleivorans (strain DSM 6200 / JCM 39069 / Hxd3) TaxID=96561 RepID=A9A083_DESOH|nr:hypothetical protein Dole_3199 [Desulfosudis oleivorans Hxd3]